eukprot:gene7165-5157_t
MYIASVSDSLKVWDVDDDRQLKLRNTVKSTSEYLCLSWNHTNQVIAVGGRENKVHIVHAANGRLLQSLQVTETVLSKFKVPTLSFSHNSRYLAVGFESIIQLWDLKERQIKNVLTGHKSPLVSVQFNSSGDFFGADEEGSIKLWSPKTYEAVNITEDNRGVRPIYSLTKLAISSIVPVVAAGYDDGTLRVWDIANGINPIFQLPVHVSKITDISCSTKNSRLIATASLDEHIHLIDTDAPSRHICSSIHVEQRISAISFHEDGMHCAVGAMDGTILMYDWRNTTEPVSITGAHEPFPVQALSFQNYRPSSSKESNSEYTTSSIRSAEKKKPAVVSDNKLVEEVRQITRSLQSDMPVYESSSKVASSTAATAVSSSFSSGSPLRQAKETTEELPPAVPAARPTKSNLRYSSQAPAASAEYSSIDEPKSVRIAVPSPSPVKAPVAVVEEKTAAFEEEYKRRIGAYLEVGQDRIHRRDRDLDDDVRQSMQLQQSVETLPSTIHSVSQKIAGSHLDDGEEFASLREATRPVSQRELDEALDLLKYDIHQELQELMREQVRQFNISKEETTQLIRELGMQLKDLVRANQELREENEYLRKIY